MTPAVHDIRLGRLFAPDARDHPMRAAMVPLVGPLPTFRYWSPGPILDQGQTPRCVAFAWEGFLNASPTRTKDGPAPDDIYLGAQQNDEWPGEGYDGTSVRGGAKWLQAQGRIGEYVFDTTLETVKQWVLTTGPVVFGTDWYTGFFTPDGGWVKMSGQIEGGHAYLVRGYSSNRGAFKCRNSWGPNWGLHGEFWLPEEYVTQLLAHDGEACAAVEIAK